MGCDIHLYVEKNTGDGWQSVDQWTKEDNWKSVDRDHRFYSGRNYNLFAILADVRNGRGFAGVDTGDPLNPIFEPRGVPDDVSNDVREIVEQWEGDGHSHSWATVAELMSYDWTQVSVQRGMVTADAYIHFLLRGRPKSWCGDVGGHGVQHLSTEDMDKALSSASIDVDWSAYRSLQQEFPQSLQGLYTRVQWEQPYFEVAQHFLSTTMPRLWRVGRPDEVRIVYFFDN